MSRADELSARLEDAVTRNEFERAANECLDELRRLDALNAELLGALKELYEGYCNAMSSEFDFPGRPWTPERDNDTAALNARAAIQKAEEA